MNYEPVNADGRGDSPERLNGEYTSYDDHRAKLFSPPSGSPPKAYSTNEVPISKEWPAESQRVWAMTPLRAFIILFDVTLASTPIMFIALALIAARLDGKQVSDYGLHLHQVLLLSPTIFPVIFAALMGRCFKYVGLYLAERGTTLGRLEQLIGCQSLFSALERQISLRSFSVVGLVLTILWLLSPLGGQSALRLLDQETGTFHSKDSVSYLNPLATLDSFMLGASSANSGRSTFASIFLAALLSYSKYGKTSMDLWGNVKLPVYRSIENTTSGEWKMVPNGTSDDVRYGSLIGVPIAHIRNSGQSNFTIKARQWDIICDSVKGVPTKDAGFGNLSSATWKFNNTSKSGKCDKLPCPIDVKSVSVLDPENEDDPSYTVADCELTYDYFETAINCNGTNCAAVSMRKLPLLGDGFTEDLANFTRGNLVFNTMAYLPTVDNTGVGSAAMRGSTNAEKWIRNPDNFIGATYDYVKLFELSPDEFSSRMTIVWNTFFQSTYATTALGGNLPQNLTRLSDVDLNLTFNATNAVISEATHAAYKTNWKWLAFLLLSSIILQIAAYAGLAFKYWTCVPDIIGYASSMTLLNPYVPTPTGGTTLHGLERAALLQDLPVRIGDVCPDEPVGAIAFAKADEGRVAKLDRNRFYI